MIGTLLKTEVYRALHCAKCGIGFRICCKRTFRNLARQMKTKHPAFTG